MALNLRTLTLRSEPPPAKGFFKLPWELRQRIYEESLIELPKWEKLHKADCPLAAKDTHSCERPPFVDESLIKTPLPDCHCARRHSLNVLLANRQVQREAAPVLWTRNVFCFTHVGQFGKEVGSMRPAHRLLLRHVSILLYTNDSQPNKHFLNFDRASADQLWDTLVQCNGLRTLEMSHGLLDDRYRHVSLFRTHLPQLESFRLTTLMAYRLWPRRDESRPPPSAAHRSWGVDGESDSEDDDGPGQAPIHNPYAAAAPTPTPAPTPAVPDHYVVLNPIVPGYECQYHPDLSRVLWFKTGLLVDANAATESLTNYTDLLRNYQTNFLVHLRHELAKLPEAWARDQPPPPPLPTRDPNQSSSSDTDSEGFVTWNIRHGLSFHSPEALRQVASRLPPHLRDGPVTEEALTLRDGRHCPVQIMGLPITRALRTRRYQERTRTQRLLHEAGKLTAREETRQKERLERRAAKSQFHMDAEARLAARALIDRRARGVAREERQRTAEREAQAEERTRTAEAQEALLVLRQATRKRVVTEREERRGAEAEGGYDEGSEADTEEEPSASASSPRARRLRLAKATLPRKKKEKEKKGSARRRVPRNSGRNPARRPPAVDLDDSD